MTTTLRQVSLTSLLQHMSQLSRQPVASSTSTRILEFKPAPPESSKPIDLRSQYNRPLKQASTQSAQFRRRIQTAPERVLDAPGLADDYYLNLLDWSSGEPGSNWS